ncbi:MAG TPA: phosphatase PAP2 family protein [Longimicrobiaceae bacterium]|nr:phosphatase PAP2 family protein [Longimicrobiaceae bacterium]
MPAWASDFLFRTEPIVWVQQFFGYGHPLPFRLVDLLATNWGVVLVAGLALWLWGREDVYALAGVVLAEAVVNVLLNLVIDVPRPSGPEIVKYEHVNLGSFPSGHVFTATVLWGLLWARGRVPLWLSALVVAAVGVGRMYLGVHYLTDVVGGALLGTLLIWLFRRAWPAARAWLGERSQGFFLAAGALGIAATVAGLLLVFERSPFLWNSAGVAVGGTVALLAEHRLVGYEPAWRGAAGAAARVAVGLLGLVPLLVVEKRTGEEALALGAVLLALGALWALLAVPALFRWWGWSRGEERAVRAVPRPASA